MFLLLGIPKYVSANSLILKTLPWKRKNAFVFSIVIDLKYFVKLIPPGYPKGMMTFQTKRAI
jgi:hypothetical protein